MPVSSGDDDASAAAGQTTARLLMLRKDADGDVATVAGPSTQTNVIIKTELPPCGIVSSNPKRSQRFVDGAVSHGLLTDVRVHTDRGWGVTIHVAKYRGLELFVGSVPMGSSGSGFAFFEMFAAGARAIVRYGSNDRQIEMSNLRDVVIVDWADNLTGMMADEGLTIDHHRQLSASPALVNLLVEAASEGGYSVRKMHCHNLEDYHAFNMSQFFSTKGRISSHMHDLEDKYKAEEQCWDMETASLFLRAQQFHMHAATVLQCLVKKPGLSSYEGEHGKVSLEMEVEFYRIILKALKSFAVATGSVADSYRHCPDEQ